MSVTFTEVPWDQLHGEQVDKTFNLDHLSYKSKGGLKRSINAWLKDFVALGDSFTVWYGQNTVGQWSGYYAAHPDNKF
jgi:hypothetical protein